MKILMTGSSGLVGTALVASLTQDGHTVYRLKRACAGGSSSAKVPPPPAIANVVDVRWESHHLRPGRNAFSASHPASWMTSAR